MVEIISIISGKGGVGKTFFAINFSRALFEFGKRVLLIDMNITTPNLSISLNVNKKYTLHDFLKGECKIEDTISETIYGFDAIVGSIKIQDLSKIDLDILPKEINKLYKKYDYIVLDSSAGFGRETIISLKSSTSSIIVTTSEKPAILEAMRAARLADNLGIPILGVVINRYRRKLDFDKVEILIGKPILGIIREDENAEISIEQRIPLLVLNPESPASIDIKKITANILGVKYEERKKKSLLDIFKKIWR